MEWGTFSTDKLVDGALRYLLKLFWKRLCWVSFRSAQPTDYVDLAFWSLRYTVTQGVSPLRGFAALCEDSKCWDGGMVGCLGTQLIIAGA